MNFKKILSVVSACVVTAAAAMGISVFAEGLPSTAYLCGSIGATSVWEAGDATSGSTVANVDGDAQYQVEWIVTDGGTSTMEFLVIQIPGLTVHQYENMKINIDSVYVDGKKLDYTSSPNAVDMAFYEKPEGATRLYLIDTWTSKKITDLPGNTTITQSIKVLFTVSGTGIAGTSNVTEETTEPSTEPTLATEETTEPATGGVEPTPTDPTDATETEPTTNAPATSANTQVTTVAANANNNSNHGGNTNGGNQVSNSTSGSPTTKGAGIAAAFAGLALTAGAAVLTKVKRK